MSIKLMAAIWDHAPQIEGNQLLALLALADMANEDGVCWPSYATIGRRTRVSRRSAIVIVQKLIEAGYITKWGRATNGEQQSNNFRLNISAIIAGGSEAATSLPSEASFTTPSESATSLPSESATSLPSESATSPEPSINHQLTTKLKHQLTRRENPKISEVEGEIRAMSDLFTNRTGIFPYRNDEWLAALQEMFVAGVKSPDLDNAIMIFQKKKLNLSGPWSVVKTAIGQKASASKPVDIGQVNA